MSEIYFCAIKILEICNIQSNDIINRIKLRILRKIFNSPNRASRGGAAASFRFKWG